MNQRQRARKLDRRRNHNTASLSREDRIAACEEYIKKLKQCSKEALIDFADLGDPPIKVFRSWNKGKIMDTIAAELRRRVRTPA